MKNSVYILVFLLAFSSCKKEDTEPAVSAPSHPVSLQLESIVLTGFMDPNANGDYWDSSTNSPDIFVEVFKDGTLIYRSAVAGSASPNSSYSMNTAAAGSLPITFFPGQELLMNVRDSDSATESQYMSQFDLDDAYDFLYTNDSATEFTDVFVSTSSHSIEFLLSGTFVY